MNTEALLALEDGTLFRGHAIGAEGCAVGEVVFNTAITGYQEILTDPSYARQMVTLTYPHIGNVGINDEDVESGGLHASGLIVRDVSQRHSNWRSQGGLSDYLKTHQVVGIAGIDTRKLTRILRDKGAQRGCILAGSLLDAERAVAEALAFPGLKGMDLAREVTTAKSYSFHQGSWHLGSGYGLAPEGPYHVVAYDFGIKFNILRLLADRGCRLTVVPATTPAKDVLALNPDGVFLSNGPGDPEPCVYAIEAIRQILEAQIPVFGICLGHQLLGLASGAKTLKMKFGHHGANHPVLEIDTGRVLITSQNHGFAIDEATLPPSVRATHRSLFDGSLQGIERTDCLAFSVQGHPEASPGPHDLMPLFDRFITNMSSVRH
ncbi:MAG: carbamoyl-phosphate synthase small subunit [Methylococcus sp.]|nr:MAG: carbamoyl-phosphate synthase small subunit [Methylococcus sp.]